MRRKWFRSSQNFVFECFFVMNKITTFEGKSSKRIIFYKIFNEIMTIQTTRTRQICATKSFCVFHHILYWNSQRSKISTNEIHWHKFVFNQHVKIYRINIKNDTLNSSFKIIIIIANELIVNVLKRSNACFDII